MTPTDDSTPARTAPPELRFAIPEPRKWILEVESIAASTPSVRTLTLGLRDIVEGAESGRLEYAPGQDLSLSLPGPTGSSVNRRYTISRYDEKASIVELEIVAHGDGPGARFLAAAVVGDEIDAFGPRGKITLAEGVATHLFFADESSLAAVSAMVAALSSGDRAIVVGDVAGPAEHRPIEVAAGVELDVRFLDRGEGSADDPARALRELGELDIDSGSTHAYAFGEFHVVSSLRSALVERLGSAHVSPKPYWRAGQPNGGHGEPPRD